MAKSAEFVSYILELLSDLGAVRSRAMFGGYGLYLEDQMFGILADDVVYFKVDDANRGTFEDAGLEPFRLESKNATMSYYTVPDAAMDDAKIMCEWARFGVEAAQRAGKNKSKKKRVRK
ncbi:MAG: TfoX/Sxy family protein [Verrucomicrobia bacterium]|nr:TfoX/Sxy family protein [Verrucomicrobiota bacterium]